ncbi:MAG: phenylalanine--tRNA ligase subunit beta [Porphyromonas sp.]|nr:MAG: phenylalanine--tRNA ligase subunit beta [Porphyromonas sp.]
MNISYDWLREYVQTNLTAEELSKALTSIGLETGGVEEVESVPGGLKGLVIGQVLTCVDHENSDHLHVTTVDIGAEEPLQIVCGAPNVGVGHAVVVATIGTVLGHGEETFTIKKGKIRGVESFGMLCSEVEIGVGHDNSGIILLPLDKVRIGMPAAEYFGVRTDEVLEVDITPNRIDATSHYGVARDVAAYLTQNVTPTKATLPEVKSLANGACPVEVEITAPQDVVARYQGVVVRGVTVGESPEWLRFRLEAIGQKPINNIVDITNYVLHEFGQPLHAYDVDKIKSKLIVGLSKPEAKVTLLDHVEHTLCEQDIVISDGSGKPVCLAGVMGAEDSGTTEGTTSIFIESANFNASYVRKSARRQGLNTDSSFRFERGLDANNTTWALARAVSLILELCPEATVDGGVYDYYPVKSEPYQVELSLDKMAKLIGKVIPQEEVKRILESLEIKVLAQEGDLWKLEVPKYRIDVTRDVDVIEDVMRIYGYNNIELSGYIHANLSSQTDIDRSYKRKILISEQLVGAGFSEILCNSLSAEAYYEGLSSYPTERLVRLLNPLSNELGVMRQSLLFGGLQSISRNLRRQIKNIHFFEWGNCYSSRMEEGSTPTMDSYEESQRLGLWISGERVSGNWAHPNETVSPFELKAHVEHILRRLAINVGLLRYQEVECDIFAGKCLEITAEGGRLLVGRLGLVSNKLLTAADIEQPVYYAELEWNTIQRLAERAKIVISELPKFPVVKRDLSLLIDQQTKFVEIEAIAYKSEKKLLKKCELFDVYEGKNLPAGKKSYAVSFFLQDETQTMSEKQIESIMSKIQRSLETQLGASLR